DRLPAADSLEHFGHVPVVGEIVERALERRLDGDLRRELKLCHAHTKICGVVTWDAGRVSTRASVAVSGPLTGAALRDGYVDAVGVLTFGLVWVGDNSVVAGSVELLLFAVPRVLS